MYSRINYEFGAFLRRNDRRFNKYDEQTNLLFQFSMAYGMSIGIMIAFNRTYDMKTPLMPLLMQIRSQLEQSTYEETATHE